MECSSDTDVCLFDAAFLQQDDGYIPNTVEKQIFETMVKIRRRDSSIYDSNKHFFAESSHNNNAGEAAKKTKASKPMLLKDVIAQQVMQADLHDAVVSFSLQTRPNSQYIVTVCVLVGS